MMQLCSRRQSGAMGAMPRALRSRAPVPRAVPLLCRMRRRSSNKRHSWRPVGLQLGTSSAVLGHHQELRAAAEYAVSKETTGVDTAEIKAALLDSLFGTERGLSASSEVRAEINELISQLEAANPNQSPTEMQEQMNGNWKLVYTSNSELMGLLAASRLPFVEVGDITQRVDTYTSTVENKVQISVPLSRTSFSASASFEVRSPKRLQIKFDKGTIKTPQLLADIDFPASISVMGQVIDLQQTRDALKPLNERLNGLISQVGSYIARQPDLQFPIPRNERAQTWLLTTYLDADTRITRGDGGSVFILVKDVSLAPVVVS